MKTKSRNILLILVMALGLLFAMSAVAFADDGQPQKWEENDRLPTDSGEYYLENNVELTGCYRVPSEDFSGKDITIDLNGHTITWPDGGGDCMIFVGGNNDTAEPASLTIKDSVGGGIIDGKNSFNYTVFVTWRGTFTLESGTIRADSGTVFQGENDATVVVNGGTVRTASEATAIDLNNDSSLTIKDGVFYGEIYVYKDRNVSVSGGCYTYHPIEFVDFCAYLPNDEWIAEGYTRIDVQGEDYYSEVVKGVFLIELDEGELYVTQGESKTLQATVLPEDAYNKDVIWSSDNEAVATVTQAGVVSGRACGKATITARAAGKAAVNVGDDQLTETCKVFVTNGIWWKKADDKLYLRAGQKEGYTEYQGGHPWGSKGYSKVIVENTIRPVDMRNWFNDAQNLEEIVNPQNIDTSSVTSMFCLFYCCKKLQSLDLSTWNTSSVTDMRNMFQFCNALTELDLTSFDVSNAQEMKSMFEGCSALENIFVKAGTDWTTQATQLTDSGTNMFNYCKKLTGEQGTTYAENRINADFARLDGGENAPGYFAVPLKVTFEDGMGNIIATRNARYGGEVTAPADPTREGYIFGGWDQDLSNITSETVKATWRVIIDNAKVVLSATSLTYNGKVLRPTIKTIKGLTLKEGTDYTAKWSNPSSKNVGTYTVTVTGKGKYIGTTKAATYKIIKAAQSITKVTPASKTYKAVKKTKKLGKTYTFTLKTTGKGNGKVTFKKANKAGASKITVSKAGKVTIKKGLKKGTYKVKVKASKAANTNYTAAAKTVIVKIIVK